VRPTLVSIHSLLKIFKQSVPFTDFIDPHHHQRMAALLSALDLRAESRQVEAGMI
jgi:hypothetical protein